ncbi:MAG TPA: glycosyltransferase family 39 protein [Candidatus Kapabacteria bacterium]|nr:glycosyltransferase family 39 protein [Candidatus Kapabacteria bacterium]
MCICLSIVIMLPVLFFPMFGDIAIFLEAGKIIANGKKIYFDYIDIKPPGFFYFFAIIYKIFGYGEMGVRFFGFLWQVVTIFIMNIVIKQYLGDNRIANISVIIYSMVFTVSGMGSNITPEAFLGLFFISALYFYYLPSKLKLFLVGIMLGIAISFKYTFGVTLFVFYALNYTYYKKSFLQYSLLITLGSLLIFIVSMIPLLDPEILQGFKDVSLFLKGYASIPAFGISYIKFLLLSFLEMFTYYYSLSFFILFALGAYFAIAEDKYKQNKLIDGLLLISLFLVFTIVIERKITGFHYTRLLLPFSILSSIGLYKLSISLEWSKYNLIKRFLIISLIPLFVFFSPLTRYAKEFEHIVYYFTDKNRFNDSYTTSGDNTGIRTTYFEIVGYLNYKAKKGDFIKVIAFGNNLINYFLSDDFRKSIFPHSCFYYAKYDLPERWKRLHTDEIHKSNWIIVSFKDNHPILTGLDRTSYESLQLDTSNYNYIKSNFVQDTIIEPFIIYKKIN